MSAAAPSPPRLARALPQVYAAALVRLAFPVLVLPLFAARLGADEFGRLSFILVWSSLLSLLVEGGFLAAATRAAVGASPAEQWRLARQIFSARIALSVAALLLAAASTAWAGPGDRHGVADAVFIGALALAFGWPATWYLQATHQLARWARVEVAMYALQLAAVLLFARSVAAYVALQFVASALLASLGWLWLRRDLAREARDTGLWSRAELRPGLRLGGSMLPVSLAGAAYSFALPAAASAQMARSELGVYYLADRIVRALLAGADPVFSLVYPRIVALFRAGPGAALAYAARWALAGAAGGALLVVGALLLLPHFASSLGRAGGIDLARVQPVLLVLAWLWPLLLGWKFFGYWMLGSGRYDRAYRASAFSGAAVGVALAATIGGAAGALGLAWTALGVESVVIVVAVAGVFLTQRLRRRG